MSSLVGIFQFLYIFNIFLQPIDSLIDPGDTVLNHYFIEIKEHVEEREGWEDTTMLRTDCGHPHLSHRGEIAFQTLIYTVRPSKLDLHLKGISLK
jgi:hypothetical protein